VKIVEVEWLDASTALEETTAKKASKNKPVLTRSIGYLLAENEHGLTLISDRWPDNPDKGFVEHFIGHGMISQIWEYE